MKYRMSLSTVPPRELATDDLVRFNEVINLIFKMLPRNQIGDNITVTDDGIDYITRFYFDRIGIAEQIVLETRIKINK